VIVFQVDAFKLIGLVLVLAILLVLVLAALIDWFAEKRRKRRRDRDTRSS
jgi:type II secretory pathway pseudopilin PulG